MKPFLFLLLVLTLVYSCRPVKTIDTKTVTETQFDTIVIHDTVHLTVIDSTYKAKYLQLKEVLEITRDSVRERTLPDGTTERTTYGEKATKTKDESYNELINRILSLDFSQSQTQQESHQEDVQTDSYSKVKKKSNGFWRTAFFVLLGCNGLFIVYWRYFKK